MIRKTGLTDEGHIAFSARFGELDDVKPYVTAGRPQRLNHYELFDVSNVAPDGSILNADGPHGQANKVRIKALRIPHTSQYLSNRVVTYIGKRLIPCRLELQPSPGWLFPFTGT